MKEYKIIEAETKGYAELELNRLSSEGYKLVYYTLGNKKIHVVMEREKEYPVSEYPKYLGGGFIAHSLEEVFDDLWKV